jgi:hypothetical protein
MPAQQMAEGFQSAANKVKGLLGGSSNWSSRCNS